MSTAPRLQLWEGGVDLIIERRPALSPERAWAQLTGPRATEQWFAPWIWLDEDAGLLDFGDAGYGLVVACEPGQAVLIEFGGQAGPEGEIDFSASWRLGATVNDDVIVFTMTFVPSDDGLDVQEIAEAGPVLEYFADRFEAYAERIALPEDPESHMERLEDHYRELAARFAREHGL